MAVGCAGLLVLVGAWSVNGPAADGGPSLACVLKTHLAQIVIQVVVLAPAQLSHTCYRPGPARAGAGEVHDAGRGR